MLQPCICPLAGLACHALLCQGNVVQPTHMPDHPLQSSTSHVSLYCLHVVSVQSVCIQEDGVHLTPEGQKVYFNAVYDTIEKKLPHIK
jgi:lysophospholipase L1-like esterase